MMQHMTVDPGLGGTGFALWDSGEKWSQVVHPGVTGVFLGKDNEDELPWLTRSRDICMRFDALFDKHQIGKVWIEYPKLHSTTSGMASAQRGDVFKLTFLVGRLAQIVEARGCVFIPLPVEKWKGTMSKEAVASRVDARLKCGNLYPNHTMDAVGMGLYLKGVFNATGTPRKRAE